MRTKQRRRVKMLGLVIWKLVTCLGSHDEGCFLWGLISSFLLFSFFFIVFFFLCFFFFFVFLFLFFSLSFGSRSKKTQSIAEVLAETLPKKRNRPNLKNWSRFSEPYSPTTVHTDPFFFFHRVVLEVKKTAKLRGSRFFRSDRYGLVRVSKSWLCVLGNNQ